MKVDLDRSEDLVQTYRRGDKTLKDAIITKLWYEYSVFLFSKLSNQFNTALSEDDIEELTSNVFAINLPKFFENPKRDDDEVLNIKKVLITIGSNLCLEELRLRNTKLRKPLFNTYSLNEERTNNSTKDMHPDSFHHLSSKDEIIMDKSEFKNIRIRLALGLITDIQRECILLCYLDGLSYQEIQKKIKGSEARVRGAINNGKARIKQLIKDSEKELKSYDIPPKKHPKVEHKLGVNLSKEPEYKVFVQAFFLLQDIEKEMFYLFFIKGINLLKVSRQTNNRRAKDHIQTAIEKIQAMLKVNQEIDVKYFN